MNQVLPFMASNRAQSLASNLGIRKLPSLVRLTTKTCDSSTMAILAPIALLSQECHAHSSSS
jgi:hypothetical protein